MGKMVSFNLAGDGKCKYHQAQSATTILEQMSNPSQVITGDVGETVRENWDVSDTCWKLYKQQKGQL